MDFVTIDFETATSARNSACEVGLTIVKNDRILGTKSWLIRPKIMDFNYFNILIHGIRPEHVRYEPEFDELWDEIGPIVANQLLIAHNASFDISVLRSSLETYGIPYPDLLYTCSVAFSRKIWPEIPKYNLKSLCDYHDIPLVHHRAGNDSEATARIALLAFEHAGIGNLEDFQNILGTTPGRMHAGGVDGPQRRKKVKGKR